MFSCLWIDIFRYRLRIQSSRCIYSFIGCPAIGEKIPHLGEALISEPSHSSDVSWFDECPADCPV